MTPKVLIVDDEENMLKLLKKILTKDGFDVRTAENGTEALRFVREEAFDLIISDLVMPMIDGMNLMKEVKSRHPDIQFILITAHGSIESAVQAMKVGAFDYLTKPFQKDEILLSVRKAIKYCKLHHEVRRLRAELKTRDCFKDIVYTSKAMESVFALIDKIADSQATVLIRGESGTGKELIARAIHDRNHKRKGPFVAVDCSVLPDHLLQSELFGHVKGAFTGAVKDNKGLFLAASGGTLFLDEIGNISPSMQINLLRVLQEREIKPVGSAASSKVDVRVLAATNADLEKSISEGAFRKDLYYRLSVVTVHVPALRERKDDIVPLAYHFMRKYAAVYQKTVTDITPSAIIHLLDNPWIGNVRELENVLERSVLLSSGPFIDESTLEFSPVLYENKPEHTHACPDAIPLKEALRRQTRDSEIIAVAEALQKSDGNKTKAAAILGISRSSLYNKMRWLGL